MKLRPALVLFEELDNVIIAGITSNQNMTGILITKKEGLVTDSIIKINYIFTVSKYKIKKLLVSLSEDKKEAVRKELRKRMGL